MTRLIHVTFAFTTLAACGGGDDDDTTSPIDAPAVIDAVSIDAPPGTAATAVDCAGITPAADIRFNGDVVSTRALTIDRGDVVRFHDLGVHTAWHTEGLWSADGDASQCVRFDGAGAYDFYCYFHNGATDETGTITVMP